MCNYFHMRPNSFIQHNLETGWGRPALTA